jgi:hypothetical protein
LQSEYDQTEDINEKIIKGRALKYDDKKIYKDLAKNLFRQRGR